MKKATLGHAIALAADVFKDSSDRGKNPYILHCLQVMYWVDQTDVELMQMAVLHDVIEDSDYGIEDLREMGYSERVLSGLTLLTHDSDMSYDDYIKGISKSKDAILVKLADLRHNSDITRMKGLRDKDIKRLEKYHRSYRFLQDTLKKYENTY